MEKVYDDKTVTVSGQGSKDEVSEGVSNEPEHGEYKRTFTARQVHVISLGGTIGSGLFIATGKALANGGPGNMIVGYAIVCSCVWAMFQTISEITIAFPTSGNFIDYADRFVDPALAFSAGFAEWLGWTAVVAAEATFFSVVVNYWAEGSVHEAVWLSVFLVFVALIFALPNKWFAWFEYYTSILKVSALIIFMIAAFAMTMGAGSTGTVHTGETWRDYPVFKNGFKGLANSMLAALWAIGDNVLTGIMAGEAKSPRHSMAHATKLVPVRVSVVYLLTVVFITILIPSTEPRLFGGSGVAASPFVIAANDAGIKGLPDYLNVIIIIGVSAVAAESIYISSRVLRAMALQGLIPKFVANVDNQGRPRWALAITTLVGVMLTYINLSADGIVVYTWLVSITSSSFFIVWMVIAITSWRFRAALKAQNDSLFTEVYAFKCWAWPFPPLYLMTVCLLLLACCIYIGLYPIGAEIPSAYNFFQYMIGVVLVMGSGLIYKIVFITKIRDVNIVDLQTGRRPIVGAELDMLNKYYAQPSWKRFLTYVQLW